MIDDISMPHSETGFLPINLNGKVPNEAILQVGTKNPLVEGGMGLIECHSTEKLQALILPTQNGHPLCP